MYFLNLVLFFVFLSLWAIGFDQEQLFEYSDETEKFLDNLGCLE